MVDIPVVIAFVLLALGVVGSLAPIVPGAVLSLAGILLYWWASGYTEPGTVLLVGLVAVALLALLVDVLAGFLSAKIGGASTTTAVIAAGAGVVGLFTVGPLGMILAVVGTVFVVELVRGGTMREGGRAAAITTLGMFGSSVAQAVLTASILIAMLALVVF